MRVERERNISPPRSYEEWFGVRNPDTVRYLVPMLQVVYKNFLNQLSPAVDWQMMPDSLDYLELSFPSVAQRFLNETIVDWGEKKNNATVLYSQGHEIAKVFKDDTGKARIFVSNKDAAFNSRLKSLIILNAVNERIGIHANQEIGSLEIQQATLQKAA